MRLPRTGQMVLGYVVPAFTALRPARNFRSPRVKPPSQADTKSISCVGAE